LFRYSRLVVLVLFSWLWAMCIQCALAGHCNSQWKVSGSHGSDCSKELNTVKWWTERTVRRKRPLQPQPTWPTHSAFPISLPRLISKKSIPEWVTESVSPPQLKGGMLRLVELSGASSWPFDYSQQHCVKLRATVSALSYTWSCCPKNKRPYAPHGSTYGWHGSWRESGQPLTGSRQPTVKDRFGITEVIIVRKKVTRVVLGTRWGDVEPRRIWCENSISEIGVLN